MHTPELERLLQNAETRFFHVLGNAFQASLGCQAVFQQQPTNEHKANVSAAKERFYAALDRFRTNYAPQGKITPDNLAILDEFRNLDWTDGRMLHRLMDYLVSLRSA